MDAERELRQLAAETECPEPERSAGLYAALGLLTDGLGYNGIREGLETVYRQVVQGTRIAHPFAYAKAVIETRALAYNEETHESAHEARRHAYAQERKGPRKSAIQVLGELLEKGIEYDAAVAQAEEMEQDTRIAESGETGSESEADTEVDEELTDREQEK